LKEQDPNPGKNKIEWLLWNVARASMKTKEEREKKKKASRCQTALSLKVYLTVVNQKIPRKPVFHLCELPHTPPEDDGVACSLTHSNFSFYLLFFY